MKTDMQKLLLLISFTFYFTNNLFADSFPIVSQIEFHDSIMWVGTNDGLYKVIFSKDKKIQWSKELEKTTQFIIDSKGTLWAICSSEGLYTYDNEEWKLMKNDTVKQIDNVYEYDSHIYILSIMNNSPTYYKREKNKWVLETNFNPPNLHKEERSVPPNKEVEVQHYITKNGVIWILTQLGNIYKYENSNWVKSGKVRNGFGGIFSIKNETEIWIGDWSYIAYLEKDRWVEFCLLTPIPDTEESGESEEELQRQKDIEATTTIGVISDPDGYTNLREMPDPNSDIVAIILTNVKFKYREVYKMDWCYVETTTGAKGYMHKSRIKKL